MTEIVEVPNLFDLENLRLVQNVATNSGGIKEEAASLQSRSGQPRHHRAAGGMKLGVARSVASDERCSTILRRYACPRILR